MFICMNLCIYIQRERDTQDDLSRTPSAIVTAQPRPGHTKHRRTYNIRVRGGDQEAAYRHTGTYVCTAVTKREALNQTLTDPDAKALTTALAE